MGACRIFSRGGQIHRRSQNFLWRGAFFLKKVDDFFGRRSQNTGRNYTTKWTTPDLPNVPNQQKWGLRLL